MTVAGMLIFNAFKEILICENSWNLWLITGVTHFSHRNTEEHRDFF